MRYYLRVLSGFVVESESELGAATGLIRGLDVRRAPGEERPLVSVVVSQDLVHWTLYHLPVPEQPSEPAASAEDVLRARAEARAAQAEAKVDRLRALLSTGLEIVDSLSAGYDVWAEQVRAAVEPGAA